MIYHSDISLWSTGPPKPRSWISFPAVMQTFHDQSHEAVPRALAPGQYPGPPHNSSYFSASRQSSVLYRIRGNCPGSGQREMQLATRKGQRREHAVQRGVTAHGITIPPVSPASFRLLTGLKAEQGEAVCTVCAAIQQYLSPAAHKQLDPSNREHTLNMNARQTVIQRQNEKEQVLFNLKIHTDA